ncbi:alpha/beta hydrolase fold domain-containing protein [Streptomyces decoyicus]|uniref:alpha/beta hydrolase fold domain-containing protein n=1 Tax=Streptomyces decoyicus TaxID=249567 RepID=UPI00364147C5
MNCGTGVRYARRSEAVAERLGVSAQGRRAVLTWTAEHAAEPGIDPGRIAVGGHSAGGGARGRGGVAGA